ncbi:hypothetical protein B0A55_11285 [Friedmanniomyces simplex]|uniref:NmrA-like domain-containing protein n=1 Tax=Friedmanniomyces simplex TaxID=329884 RepID=A0A4U0WAE7_9PEZI|nr:hypothetical protein B0A55_11285 [Friedmanniomyces simplex]
MLWTGVEGGAKFGFGLQPALNSFLAGEPVFHSLHYRAGQSDMWKVGSTVLKHLLESPDDFKITVVTRADSQATFPSNPSITVKKGSYTDGPFLQDAFKNQDVVIFALHFMVQEAQIGMIDEAAKAGVKWIVPNEYSGDGLNESMVEGVPVSGPKRQARRHIEELSKTHEGLKWIGVATNPFFEPFLIRQAKMFGIDSESHTATIYSDAGAFNASTMDQIGLAVTRTLSLPISDKSNPRASLQHYANNFLYVSSFCVTQKQILQAFQKAKGDSEADWKVIDDKTIKQWMQDCQEGLKQGNMQAGWGLTMCYYMGEGLGGNYEDKAKQDRKVLDLPEEDFEEAVKRALKA